MLIYLHIIGSSEQRNYMRYVTDKQAALMRFIHPRGMREGKYSNDRVACIKVT